MEMDKYSKLQSFKVPEDPRFERLVPTVVLLRAMRTFRRQGQGKESEVPGGMTLKETVGSQALPCHLLASGPGGEELGLTTWLARMYDLAIV